MLKTCLKNSMKRKWKSYIVLVFLVVLIVLAEILPPKLLEYFINTYLIDASEVTKTMLLIIVSYVSILFLGGIFDFIKQMILIHLGTDFTMEIRSQMALKLTRVKSRYLMDTDSGELTSRFQSDVDLINSLFSDGILSMGIDLLKIIAILVAMFLYSIYLGLLSLAFVPIILGISMLFKKRMFTSQVKSRKMIGRVNNHISESFRNARMIKIYDKEEYMIEKNTTYLDENYSANLKVSFYDGIYAPIIQILTALAISILVITTHISSLSIGLSIGALAGAIEYVTSLFTPVESLGMELQQIQKAASGLYRVKEFLMEEEDMEKESFFIEDFLNQPLRLEFKNVSFSYNGEVNVLEDISFDLSKDIKVSFIGRTGAGKTTLFRLITGEMKPTCGTVTLNGIPTIRIPNEYKYRIFGYVSQEFKPMLGESIRDNITMKNKTIEENSILSVLELVGMKNTILSLENGLDTRMKGSMLSEGELELLNIARAILSNPKILLLDEMTASLDSATEKRILDALNKAKHNRMILQISHRLSTTLDSDSIISIENARLKYQMSIDEFTQQSWMKDVSYANYSKNAV